jgi:hypothetical protein
MAVRTRRAPELSTALRRLFRLLSGPGHLVHARSLLSVLTAALMISTIVVATAQRSTTPRARQKSTSGSHEAPRAWLGRTALASANADPCDGDAPSGTNTGDVTNWLSDPGDYLGAECPQYAYFLGELFGGSNPDISCR